MGLTIKEKIIKNHLVSGKMINGSEISIKIVSPEIAVATAIEGYIEDPRVYESRS